MSAEPVSVLSKISDIVITENEFTPDGEKTPVRYKRLVAVVAFDGVEEEIEFTASQGKLAYRLLQQADDVN